MNNKKIAALDVSMVDKFVHSLRGPVIRPGDERYEGARKVYNGMIDRCPGLIVQCADVADVGGAVHFARDNGVAVASKVADTTRVVWGSVTMA